MALDAYFQEKDCINPLTHGVSWKLDGEEVITYQLVHMVEPGNTAAARIQGGCHIQTACASGSADTPPPKAAWRGDTHRRVPYIAHATGCEAALQILCDGHIKTNPGNYGIGIYGYAAEDDSEKSIGKIWERGRFYNRGASFLLQTDGVVCVKMNSVQDEIVPEGVMGCHGRGGDTQFLAGPRTVRYHSVTFAVQGLLESLDSQLARSGYGAKLHAALQQVASFTAGGGAASSSNSRRAVPGDSVELLNRIVQHNLPGQPRGGGGKGRRASSGSPRGRSRSGSPTEAGNVPSPSGSVLYPPPAYPKRAPPEPGPEEIPPPPGPPPHWEPQPPQPFPGPPPQPYPQQQPPQPFPGPPPRPQQPPQPVPGYPFQPYPQQHLQAYSYPKMPPMGWPVPPPPDWGQAAPPAWGAYDEAAHRAALEAGAAAARQQYAMAGGMFQGPASQWRLVEGRWQPAAPEAPQQIISWC